MHSFRYLLHSFLCCGFLAGATLQSQAQEGSDPSGIVEAMAIEEIAEEGVKAAVVAGILTGEEAEALGAAADVIYTEPGAGSEEPEEIDRAFIGLLGESLKSEVEQGRMDESEGWAIYLEAVADVRSWYAQQKEEGREVTVPWSRRPAESGGLSTLHLMNSDLRGDHRLVLLARPEYLRRDARYIAAELELDATMAEILALMIDDYVAAYEAAVDRFLASVEGGQRRVAIRTLDRSLARIASVQIDSLDWEAIRRGNPWMNKDQAAGQLWVEDALGTFQRVIGGIREDLAEQDTDLELELGESPTTTQSIEALNALRRTRVTMRNALEEQMRALVPAGEEARYERLLMELALARTLNTVSLSGTRLDFSSALREAAGIRSFEALPGASRGLVANALPVVIEPARTWMDAELDAEVAGYAMMLKQKAAGGAIGESDRSSFARALREATEREVVLRDTMQSVAGEIREALAENDPGLADRYQREIRTQGFPIQMRTRWCERAAEAVLAFEDLDPQVHESVLEFHDGTLEQLPLLRQQAIQACREIEEGVARERITLLFDGLKGSPIELASVVREPGHRRFMELDDRTEEFLKVVLSEEQFARVPRRPGTRLPEWDQKGSGKGGGKGSGKGGKAAGKGSGKGAGGKGRGTAAKGGSKG